MMVGDFCLMASAFWEQNNTPDREIENIKVAILPESVTNPILKVHKVLVVQSKQIARVEVQVTFLQHITEPLLLSLLLVTSVPNKRRSPSDPAHQKSCVTWQNIHEKCPSQFPIDLWSSKTQEKQHVLHFRSWSQSVLKKTNQLTNQLIN